MKISEVISELEGYKDRLGDVDLCIDEDDGRSSWVSPYVPVITKSKVSGYKIHAAPYGIKPRGLK